MSDNPSSKPPSPRRWGRVDFSTGEGLDEMADVEALAVGSADDDNLAQLVTSTNVVQLMISGTFSDEGLASLRALPRLEHLFIHSPNVEGAGLGALAGSSALRVLGLRDTRLTPKGARRCTTGFPDLTSLHMSGPTIGNDHLVALRPHPTLESVMVTGGGDFLGGGDCKLDRASAVDLVVGCPELKFFGAWWSNGMSMLAERTIIAMCETRPGATINGAWYDQSIFVPQETDELDDLDDFLFFVHEDQPVRDATLLSNDDFDRLVGGAPVAVVKCWSSSNRLSQKALIDLARELDVMDQVAQVLDGQALVGTVDIHLQPELADKLGDGHHSGVGTVSVFRRGRLVARMRPASASMIVALLEPVFEPPRGPGGWSETETAPQFPS